MSDRIFQVVTPPGEPPHSFQAKTFAVANAAVGPGFVSLLAEPLGGAPNGGGTLWCNDVCADALYLYVAVQDGYIYRWPRDGSAPPARFANGNPFGAFIMNGCAVDDTYLYGVSDVWNSVIAFDVNTGALVDNNYIDCSVTGGSPTSIRIDPTGQFWVVGSGSGNNDGRIGHADIQGGILAALANTGIDGGSPYLATDENWIFWSNTLQSKIGRCAWDGSAANPNWLTCAFNNSGIASDGTYLYIMNNSAGEIYFTVIATAVSAQPYATSWIENPKGICILD